MKIQHINGPYFRMSSDDALKCISYLSGVIGLLEGKWPRPQSALEAAILKQLLDVRETVRAAYEAQEDEYCWKYTTDGWSRFPAKCAVTLPAFFEAASYAAYRTLESRGEL
jgi:hypothetical protein